MHCKPEDGDKKGKKRVYKCKFDQKQNSKKTWNWEKFGNSLNTQDIQRPKAAQRSAID